MSVRYYNYYGDGYNSCVGYSRCCYSPNYAPVANNDCISVYEDKPLTISPSTLLNNDTDKNGDRLTIVSVQNAAHGTVSLVSGNVVFTPAANYNGPASFSYTVSDGNGGTSTATVSVNICSVNDAPDAVNDNIAATAAGPVTISAATLLANDKDIEGDAITIKSVQSAVNGTVALVNGQVIFTPNAGFSGAASFTYTISDGKGATDVATVCLTIPKLNANPDALNDTITGNEDSLLVISPLTLLANDTDADGNTLTISSVQGAVNGTVALVGSNVVFTPAANYNGPASFTYTITDGQGGSDTATVNLNICPVNDAPVVGSSAVTVSEEGLVNGIVDTIGDPADLTDVTVVTGSIAVSDADSASLTISLIAPTQQYSSHGTLITWSGVGSNILVGNAGAETIATISIDNNGQYRFTLTGTLDHPNMTTEDVLNVQFGVKVSDGATTSKGTITVAVEDDAPSVIAQTVDLIESDNVNIMIVLDTSGSMQTTDGVNGQTRLQTANEAIVKLLDKYEADSNVMVRLVTFASNASALGTEWVTVATAKVLLNNLIAVGGTNYDEALGDAMTAFADAGKLSNAQNVSYFFSDGAPTYGSGSIDELTPQGASPGTPAFNGTGYDQTGADVGIQVNEALAWTNFLTQNQIKSYSLGIGSGISNQAYLDPIAYNGQTQTDMNGLLVSNFNQLDDVLVNTIKEVNGQLISGAYSFGADGGYVESITIGAEIYTFVPSTGVISHTGGTSSYSYNATTHMLIVTTLIGGKFTIDMDSGVYSYTPSNNASNQLNDVIGFKLVDGDGDYASSTITFVAPQTNTAPNAIDDGAIVGNEDTPVVIAQATLLANDTDADGNTLTISSVQNVLNGTVALVGGDVVFIPAANYHGPASFTYTITDGNGGISTAIVNLEVAATPPPPPVVVPSVSEEGLVGGIVDNTGVIDTSNSNVLSGFVSFNGTATLSLVAPTVITTSSGEIVTWQGNGTQALSAYAGSVQVATLTINNLGAYTFELNNSFDHPVLNVEDVISLDFEVVTTDGVSITHNPLVINVEDDMPSATARADNVAMIDTNLLITLDVSGSMLQASGIDSQNRLQSAVQSISSLLDTYKTFGDVRVRLVTFSSEAQAVGNEWFTVQEAKDALNLVALSGVTNYDAAIGTTIAAYDAIGKLDNAQVLSYFFSDGDPNRGNGDESQLLGSVTASATDRGIQSAEEATWKAFLTENQIKAFAIGMGSEILSPEKLDPIAYDGQAQKDISGVVVTQFSDLTQVLADTVEASNTKGALDLGADNGFLKSVTMEGVSYTYNQQSNDISVTGGADASQFDALAGLLTVTMSSGGKFEIDVNNGTYQYLLPPNITTPIVERFDYLASDFDGDTAGATVNVTVTKTNVLTGTSANDTLLGNTGPDLIIGREGNDVINGNRGDDRLFAGEGDDTLIGGQGDDKLSGGTGADTFVWSLGDVSGLGMEIDTIVDFDTSTNFEALNLSDLLQGESSSADSLENYLHFNFQSGNTVISVSSAGLFADNNNVGSMFGSATDQQIILLGVDLIGASATDAQVLQNLLTQQKLITD